MAKRLSYSFKKGCGKVSKENFRQLNQELREYLGCKTLPYYYRKRNQIVDIPAHVKTGIEDIFRRYDITDPDEIWTITELSDEQ